jgi:hypothetical protein
LLVDRGYTGQLFADSVMNWIKANVQVVTRNELHFFVVLARLCIVERPFAWLGTIPSAMEEPRTQAEFKFANDPLGLHKRLEIVNRLKMGYRFWMLPFRLIEGWSRYCQQIT